jgi:hypothetical protein
MLRLALLWALQDSSWDPKNSLDYILKHQNKDGTWFTGLQVNPDSGGGITVGTTGLACLALLDYYELDPKAIRPVIEKGLEGCLKLVWRKDESVKKLTGGTDFESINWGQIYTLQLLSKLTRHPDWKKEEKRYRKEMEELLPWFYKRQGSSGGWGYAGSFQTAVALVMLKDVKDAGVEVRQEAVDRGVALMQKFRHPKGFLYSAGASKQQWEKMAETDTLDDSAGRNALCEYTLLLYDKSTAKDLEAAFQKGIDHREFLWKTRALTREGKWLRNGGASPYAYFAFFGYRYNALALSGVSADKRKEWSALMRKDLMAVLEKDGTWINLPVSYNKGKAEVEYDDQGNRKWSGMQPNVEPGNKIYSTSMALMALKALNGK